MVNRVKGNGAEHRRKRQRGVPLAPTVPRWRRRLCKATLYVTLTYPELPFKHCMQVPAVFPPGEQVSIGSSVSTSHSVTSPCSPADISRSFGGPSACGGVEGTWSKQDTPWGCAMLGGYLIGVLIWYPYQSGGFLHYITGPFLASTPTSTPKVGPVKSKGTESSTQTRLLGRRRELPGAELRKCQVSVSQSSSAPFLSFVEGQVAKLRKWLRVCMCLSEASVCTSACSRLEVDRMPR